MILILPNHLLEVAVAFISANRVNINQKNKHKVVLMVSLEFK
jgi:hypothetical protein